MSWVTACSGVAAGLPAGADTSKFPAGSCCVSTAYSPAVMVMLTYHRPPSFTTTKKGSILLPFSVRTWRSSIDLVPLSGAGRVPPSCCARALIPAGRRSGCVAYWMVTWWNVTLAYSPRVPRSAWSNATLSTCRSSVGLAPFTSMFCEVFSLATAVWYTSPRVGSSSGASRASAAAGSLWLMALSRRWTRSSGLLAPVPCPLTPRATRAPTSRRDATPTAPTPSARRDRLGWPVGAGTVYAGDSGAAAVAQGWARPHAGQGLVVPRSVPHC